MSQLDALTGTDCQLVVVALQALHRERVTAFGSAFTAATLAGHPAPEQSMFGLNEVNDALRRIGAAPGVY